MGHIVATVRVCLLIIAPFLSAHNISNDLKTALQKHEISPHFPHFKQQKWHFATHFLSSEVQNFNLQQHSYVSKKQGKSSKSTVRACFLGPKKPFFYEFCAFSEVLHLVTESPPILYFLDYQPFRGNMTDSAFQFQLFQLFF